MLSVPRTFFARPADVVAPALLGCTLRRTLDDGSILAGRIVEAEAYLGPEDRASHAWNGRRTPRNESMYARPGACYVYLTYGMHFMCNVACLRAGHPAAVLIRALEPLEGLDRIRAARPGIQRDRDLCRGPGRLCQALSITRDLDAIDLLTDSRLRLLRPAHTPDYHPDHPDVARTARIGVDSCGSWATAPLRFFLRDSPFVSPGRPSQDRPRPARPPRPSRVRAPIETNPPGRESKPGR